MNTFKWILKCEDGNHSIVLQQLGTPRDPMQLYVDGEKTELSMKKTLFVKFEHVFICGGEPVLLLVFGNKADLVFRNKLQTANKKYDSKNKIPQWFVIALSLLNLLLPIFFKVQVMSALMSVSSSILVYLFSITPFLSKIEKISKSTLITVLNGAIAILASMVF